MKSPRRGSAAVAGVLLGGLAAAAVACAALSLLPTPAVAADDDLLGALKRVEKVIIEGNRSIDAGTLKKVLKTGDKDFLGLRGLPLFRPDFLRSDVGALQTLYIRRGYPDAVATAVADSGSQPGRVIVIFRVTEGPLVLVRSVSIDSTTMFDREELLRIIKVKPEGPFDPVQMPIDRALLGAHYAERGHFPVIETTTARDLEASRVDVRFVIKDGPPYHVSQLKVSGVTRVDTSAVVREILLEPGDLYRRDRLTESTERLSGSGLFTSVEIQPVRPDSGAARVELEVRVRERRPRWLEGGIGTGTDEIIRMGGQWGHRNLSGDGKTLTATAKAGWKGADEVNSKAELAFVEPWFLGTRTRGRVAISAERGFDEFSGRTYVQEAAGLSFGLSRDYFSARSRVTVTFDNTWTRVARVITTTPGDTSTFYLAPYLPRLTLRFDQDLRNDPLLPTGGALVDASVELAGDPQANAGWYTKWQASSGFHRPQGVNSTVAFRLRGGIIRPVGSGEPGPEGTLARVPITDRYRVGGSASVRGYHENGLDAGGDGGVMFGVMNLEWRRRVRGAFGLTLFVDAGNSWRDPSHITLAGVFTPTGVANTYGLDDAHWAGGVGVHLVTPVGPVRFDYARRFFADESDLLAGRQLERVGYHFAIGFMF